MQRHMMHMTQFFIGTPYRGQPLSAQKKRINLILIIDYICIYLVQYGTVHYIIYMMNQ